MANRGRPKGSKNKKTVVKEYNENFSVPKDAVIWYEIWYDGKFLGYVSKDSKARAGIGTLLRSAMGNLTKAKKLDYNKMYFPHLTKDEPKGKKNAPVHITKVI